MEDTTMKKAYNQPTITVVRFSATPLLTGSDTLNINKTPVSGSSSDAKGGGFWSDDEPEDEYYD